MDLLCLFAFPLVLIGCTKKNPEDDPDTPTKEHVCHDICLRCDKCADPDCTDPKCATKCTCEETGGIAKLSVPTKNNTYLILDDGNYGGNYNKEEYGEGAPCNGEYDNNDSIYYSMHDYYNMKCTSTRTLIPHFQGYQQQMEKTDGLACAVAILNYEGKDVASEYSEYQLMQKYNSVNTANCAKDGIESSGLVNLFNELGYDAEELANIDAPQSYEDFSSWLELNLLENKYVILRYQDGINYQYHIVIGIDTMGEGVADDVLIFADPFDASDHFQDGYSVYHQKRMYHWWLGRNDNGSDFATKEAVIVQSKVGFKFVKDVVDPVYAGELIAPECHLLLNKDGTIGGYYGDGRYSNNSLTPKAGYLPTPENLGHLDYTYYPFPDYFNMEDEGSLLICTGFRAFKQTMASSCGICSTMATLDWYGEINWGSIGDYINRHDFYGYDPITNPDFGGVDDDDNGRKQEAIVMIYMRGDTNFSDSKGNPINSFKADGYTSKFYSYGGVGASKLKKVSEVLGYKPEYGSYGGATKNFKTFDAFKTWAVGHLQKHEPMQVSWNPTGGHWEVLMGYYDMGTDYLYDDVVILADSSDGVDHYTDGYNTLPAHVFYGTWYNGSGSTNQQRVCFGRKFK